MAKKLTYEEAGVSIEKGDAFVKALQYLVKRTYEPRVISLPGGFGGLFSLDHEDSLFKKKYRNPVLVASTDGVGTKLKLAFMSEIYNTIGMDLVAMCVDDIIVQGAEPLFFLDYLATGKLKNDVLLQVVEGISKGCEAAGCALLGGETAEHPGFYPEGEFDMAGFAVGVVEKRKLLKGDRAEPGDIILGLASSGVHSNGYSLVRKILFEALKLKIDSHIKELGRTVADEFLTPTKIYCRKVLKILKHYKVKKVIKGMAHITGGGLVGNIPRVIPAGTTAVIKKKALPALPVFKFLQEAGNIEEPEMFRTFNMGVGFVMIVGPYYADSIVTQFKKLKEEAIIIGEIKKGERGVRIS